MKKEQHKVPHREKVPSISCFRNLDPLSIQGTIEEHSVLKNFFFYSLDVIGGGGGGGGVFYQYTINRERNLYLISE